MTLANGTDTVTRTYQASGALATEASSLNASMVSYTYRGGSLRETAALDDFVVAYGYEGDYLQSVESGGRTFSFAYDDQGRRATLTYPNGLRAVSSYATHLPWLESLRGEGGGGGFDVAYTHDAVGNRLTKNVGSMAETYGYDPLDRLTRVDRTAPSPSTSLFSYDAAGNRSSQQIAGVARALTYDARNRLTSSGAGSSMHVAGTTSEPASVNVQGQVARMLPGNIFEVDVPAGQTALTVEATDASGNTRTNTYQVTSTGGSGTYTHDANGNITGKTEAGIAWTYEWNAENQLLRVTKDGTEAARFGYDPLGRRVAKVAGGVTYSYTYDGADILRETVSDGSSTTTHRYIHGPGIDEPLARVDPSGQASYYHADGLGSIVRMTNQAGAVVQTRQYDAWGNLEAGASEPGYAFTGREWDPETGLYYYRARYYDPKIGRFISEDPIGFAADVNFYGYVGANPTGWRDPLGLAEFPTQGTLPGTNIPYRMDMNQAGGRNMHVYWEGTTNGPQTIVSEEGGWLLSHGSKNVVKPPMKYRTALRQVARSFVSRCSRRALGVAGNLLDVATGIEADAARELRAAERGISVQQQAWDDSVAAGTPGYLWSFMGLIPVANPAQSQTY